MTAYLLDVTLLLALADPAHVHHDAAHEWFAETGRAQWATCPLTENGFVRIASHPKYPNSPGDVATVLGMLRVFCSGVGHTFWSGDVSIRDLIAEGLDLSHADLTDVYLLGLAVHRGGKLATLDSRIPVSAVTGGASALELVPV